MSRHAVLLLLLTLGCAGSPEPGSGPAASSSAASSSAASSSSPAQDYDLHEWGLVSVSPRGFEVAAGPGQRVARVEELTIDKPVLYVHADAPLDLEVTVSPGAGLTVPEHWPPVEGALRWSASARPGPCARPSPYPSTCLTPDGYCETAELARYETDDAACLTVGPHAQPLLFYRLAAPAAPELPLSVSRAGVDVVVRNTASRAAVGGLWRVRWDPSGDVTRVLHVETPEVGQTATIGLPSQDPSAARRLMRAELGAHGLTASETQAFMRAWDEALFGRAGSVDVDQPVAVDDETPIDSLTADIPQRGGPRVSDAILYWLPQDAISTLARVEAVPAPRALRRVMLVRVDVNGLLAPRQVGSHAPAPR